MTLLLASRRTRLNVLGLLVFLTELSVNQFDRINPGELHRWPTEARNRGATMTHDEIRREWYRGRYVVVSDDPEHGYEVFGYAAPGLVLLRDLDQPRGVHRTESAAALRPMYSTDLYITRRDWPVGTRVLTPNKRIWTVTGWALGGNLHLRSADDSDQVEHRAHANDVVRLDHPFKKPPSR